jgi:ubiquitin-like modifier-activating enzyme ATG7
MVCSYVSAWASPEDNTPLGSIPHQIRGFLGQFNNLLLVGSAYDKCTACSIPILKEYASKGHDFILEALSKPSVLETITGLHQMKDETEEIDVEWDGEDF